MKSCNSCRSKILLFLFMLLFCGRNGILEIQSYASQELQCPVSVAKEQDGNIFLTMRFPDKATLSVTFEKAILMKQIRGGWEDYQIRSVSVARHHRALSFELYIPSLVASYVFILDLSDKKALPILLAPVALKSPRWIKERDILLCIPGDDEQPPEISYIYFFDIQRREMLVLRSLDQDGKGGMLEIDPETGDVFSVNQEGASRRIKIAGDWIAGLKKRGPVEYKGWNISGAPINPATECVYEYGFSCQSSGFSEKGEFIAHDNAVYCVTWVNNLPTWSRSENIEYLILPMPTFEERTLLANPWTGYIMSYEYHDGNYELTRITLGMEKDVAKLKKMEMEIYDQWIPGKVLPLFNYCAGISAVPDEQGQIKMLFKGKEEASASNGNQCSIRLWIPRGSFLGVARDKCLRMVVHKVVYGGRVEMTVFRE